ncbi:MAG: hypothetical protein ACYC56_11660 [Candidatus Aquicultor sp.]
MKQKHKKVITLNPAPTKEELLQHLKLKAKVAEIKANREKEKANLGS